MRRTVDGAGARLGCTDEALRTLDIRLAHEVRGPVASARGLAEIVREALAEGDAAEAERAIALLERSLADLDALVGELSGRVRRERLAAQADPAGQPGPVDDGQERT